MTRRRFLTWAFWTGAAGLAYQYGLWGMELSRGGRSIGRTTGAPRIAVPTVCRLCPARCGVLAYLEDGILVKIEGNPRDPNAQGGICAKGLAGVQLFAQPDRMLRPLRRVGPRGSGRWEAVEWDGILSELTSRLTEIRAGDHPGFVYLGGPASQGIDPLIQRFLRAFGGAAVAESRTLWHANRARALELTWGADSYIPDLVNTKYALNFGANPYETGEMYVPLARRLIEGRRRGVRLVTFDPRLSRTAGKSDEWFPIRPGTDGAVALAMANVIVQLGLYDRAFLKEHFNWSLESLAEHLRPYTPERAEQISGVKAGHIRRIAVEFATTHPAVALTGGGLSQHANGVQNERAVFLLAALTGNLERRGGLCLPRRFELSGAQPRPAGALQHIPPQELFARIAHGGQEPALLWIDQANPAYEYPEPHLVQEVLQDEEKIPFIVVSDVFRTETAELADVILPAVTYLESWGLHSPPAYDLVPFVALQQQVVSTPGEARPIPEVFLDLARRMGRDFEVFFPFDSVKAFVEKRAEALPDLAQEGGLDYLMANGIWAPTGDSDYGRAFPTPSGMLEVFSPRLAEARQPALPTYMALESGELSEGEFQLVVFESAIQGGGATPLLWWLMEIEHHNPLWMNTEVAKRMGIREGDRIVIASDTGEISAHAFPTQGMHPQVVAIHGGLGHWALGRLAQGGAFRSPDANTRLIWWNDAGVHVPPLIPVRSDPMGQGQVWQGVIVRLRVPGSEEVGTYGS